MSFFEGDRSTVLGSEIPIARARALRAGAAIYERVRTARAGPAMRLIPSL